MNNQNLNSENENPLDLNKRGRTIGSRNKLTGKSKEILFDLLKDDLPQINKLICSLPFDERLTQLKYFSKYLASGNDSIANEVRAIIYEQLKPHFKRMNTFISHVSQEKRLSELRAFLKLLGPEKIEEVITDMHVNQKVRFTKG